MSVRLLGAFGAIYFVWGSTFLAIKVVVGLTPPLLAAGIRAAVAGAVLYWLARLRGARHPRRAHWVAGTAAGVMLFVGGHGAIFWSSQFVPSSLVAILESTVPAWVLLMEGVGSERRRVSRREIVGVCAGLIGIVWLNAPDTRSGAVPLVSLVALAGAASWAAGSLWYRGERRPDAPMMAAGLPMLTGGALLLLLSVASGEAVGSSLGDIDSRAVAALAYLLIFGSLLAFSAYSWLLGRVSPSKVASYAYVNPVVALLLGALVAGESIHPSSAVPIGLVLGSAFLIVTGAPSPGGRGVPRGPLQDTSRHHQESS